MDIAINNVAVILVVAEGPVVMVGEVVDLVVLLLLLMVVSKILNILSSSWEGTGSKW